MTGGEVARMTAPRERSSVCLSMPMTAREFSIAAPLLALAIFFGVYPQALLNYMQPSVNKTVVELTEWTKSHDKNTPPQPATVATPVIPRSDS